MLVMVDNEWALTINKHKLGMNDKSSIAGSDCGIIVH